MLCLTLTGPEYSASTASLRDEKHGGLGRWIPDPCRLIRTVMCDSNWYHLTR